MLILQATKISLPYGVNYSVVLTENHLDKGQFWVCMTLLIGHAFEPSDSDRYATSLFKMRECRQKSI